MKKEENHLPFGTQPEAGRTDPRPLPQRPAPIGSVFARPEGRRVTVRWGPSPALRPLTPVRAGLHGPSTPDLSSQQHPGAFRTSELRNAY